MKPVKVDPANLVDPSEVAAMIGLGNIRGVAVYRKRHADFPTPIIDRGRCVLWLRADVERWAAGRRGAEAQRRGPPARGPDESG